MLKRLREIAFNDDTNKFEARDTAGRKVSVPLGNNDGVGDHLFAAFDLGGLASTVDHVPLNALYEPEQIGGDSLELDTDTGIVTALRDAILDGSMFGDVTPAASNAHRGVFQVQVNDDYLHPIGSGAFSMDDTHLSGAGRLWRLGRPFRVSKGDEVKLVARNIEATTFTVNYAELNLFVVSSL